MQLPLIKYCIKEATVKKLITYLTLLCLLIIPVTSRADGFFGGGSGCSSAGCGLSTASWQTYFASTYLPYTGVISANHVLVTDGTGANMVDGGALYSYTPPGTNLPLCRTGASSIGACSTITDVAYLTATGTGLVVKIAVAVFDGGASALSATNPTHQVVYLESAFAATVTGYQISCPSNIGGTTRNLIFDVWDIAYSGDTLPTVGQSMCASGTKPQLTYGSHSLVKAAWACTTATTVGAGDSLAITIGTYPTSATGTWCSITLYGTRN